MNNYNYNRNRFALVYDHRNLQLKRTQVSSDLKPLPDSVQVGDLWRGQPIVALATDIDDFAAVLKDELALYEQGKQRLLELKPQQKWRYYTLFRFYIVDPQYATTVEEKVAIDLLGETQTTRVVGHNEPDELGIVEIKGVWAFLKQFEAADGSVLKSGPLDGAEPTRCRSVDTIDTETETYKDWQPLGTQLIDNPCPTITVEAKPV